MKITSGESKTNMNYLFYVKYFAGQFTYTVMNGGPGLQITQSPNHPAVVRKHTFFLHSLDLEPEESSIYKYGAPFIYEMHSTKCCEEKNN